MNESITSRGRNGSIGAFLAMLLPAIAAALGGLPGSREEVVEA